MEDSIRGKYQNNENVRFKGGGNSMEELLWKRDNDASDFKIHCEFKYKITSMLIVGWQKLGKHHY